MKRAAIYIRVSTDEQAEKGYSLPSQVDACKRYAEQHGLTVVAEFRDDYSGASLDRQGLSSLREMIRRGELDAVIIYCADRLSRKLAHALVLRDEFERHHIERHTVMRGQANDNAESRMIENIESVFAEYEREKIRERTTRGKMSAAKKGLILNGGKPPFGYRFEAGHPTIEKTEANLVCQMYQWYLSGEVDRAIARRLSEMSIPTPYERYERMGRKRVRNSCMWGTPTVRRILTSEAYVGRLRLGKVIGNGGRGGKRNLSDTVVVACPPIVPDDVWRAAQEKRKFNKQVSKRNTKRQYLLRSMVKCGHCGYRMCGKSQPPRKNRSNGYAYYDCGRKLNQYPGLETVCSQRALRAEQLESVVWQFVVNVLTGDSFEQGIRDAQLAQQNNLQVKQETLDSLEHNLSECKREMSAFVALLAKAESTLMQDTINEKVAALEKTYAALATEREQLKSEIEEKSLSEEQIMTAIEFRTAILEGLKDPSFEEKRLVLEQLRCEVVVQGKKGVVKLHFPAVQGEFDFHTP